MNAAIQAALAAAAEKAGKPVEGDVSGGALLLALLVLCSAGASIAAMVLFL